jgi:hypothetical protein
MQLLAAGDLFPLSPPPRLFDFKYIPENIIANKERLKDLKIREGMFRHGTVPVAFTLSPIININLVICYHCMNNKGLMLLKKWECSAIYSWLTLLLTHTEKEVVFVASIVSVSVCPGGVYCRLGYSSQENPEQEHCSSIGISE